MSLLLSILTGNIAGLNCCGGWGSGFFGRPGYGMMGGYGPFGMIFGGLFWLVIIALVIWAIWYFTAGRSGVSKSGTVTPLEILKKRLASGEITPEQFAKTKKTLEEKK
jgi:putative membrane protein